MGLRHRIERAEHARGASALQKSNERQKHLQLEASLAEHLLRFLPEYWLVRREDCDDEETWNRVLIDRATARGDFREVERLRTLPAPRREADLAWIEQATTLNERMNRFVERREGLNLVKKALQRAKERSRCR